LTHNVNRSGPDELAGAPWIRIFPLRTPTLPPATHTNVYIVGHESLVIIDPASPYPEEQQALDDIVHSLHEAGERVHEIVLTHHHFDHVAGAAHLAARFNLPVAAHAETRARVSDRIAVARTLADGERLPYGPRGLVGLHTPGHAPGHLCFLDEEACAIIAGDMVASVGTIIVAPDDDGDMAQYLASLRRLRAVVDQGAHWLLPAHGPPIADAAARLDFYIAHRLERERRVAAALSATPQTVEQLVPPAYPDVAPALYGLAAQSLLAHLIKLEREGRAQRAGDSWTLP
jgi:glyoxylase-like metal-dependent hydrolase (beta-lactamase superfamily II)